MILTIATWSFFVLMLGVIGTFVYKASQLKTYRGMSKCEKHQCWHHPKYICGECYNEMKHEEKYGI